MRESFVTGDIQVCGTHPPTFERESARDQNEPELDWEGRALVGSSGLDAIVDWCQGGVRDFLDVKHRRRLGRHVCLLGER